MQLQTFIAVFCFLFQLGSSFPSIEITVYEDMFQELSEIVIPIASYAATHQKINDTQISLIKPIGKTVNTTITNFEISAINFVFLEGSVQVDIQNIEVGVSTGVILFGVYFVVELDVALNVTSNLRLLAESNTLVGKADAFDLQVKYNKVRIGRGIVGAIVSWLTVMVERVLHKPLLKVVNMAISKGLNQAVATLVNDTVPAVVEDVSFQVKLDFNENPVISPSEGIVIRAGVHAVLP